MTNSAADAKMDELLDALTVAMQQGDEVESLLSEPPLAADEAAGLAALIQRLCAGLVPVQPRAEFVEETRRQLLDSRPAALQRVRQIPARVHIAAILAVVAAGFGLLRCRRVFGAAAAQDISEEPLAV